MSLTKTRKEKSHAQIASSVGKTPVMSTSAEFQNEREAMKDALAQAKDVMSSWPIKMIGGKPALPLISIEYGVLMIPLPMGSHVIERVVMSDGKTDYKVDGEPIIPVTSELPIEKPSEVLK